MKKKLETPEDIQLLINIFYTKVFDDKLLLPYFKPLKEVSWNKHLEAMNLFWCNVVFYSGGYLGNPIAIHQKMHAFKNFAPEHFERWLQLFNSTVNALFKGEKAELIKKRAHSIATVMQLKILPQAEEVVGSQ